MPLVLASGSPRRSLLLSAAGYTFTVKVPGVDETLLDVESPEAYVLRLSGEKANAVVSGSDEVILGADTVVVVDGLALGKPATHDEAVLMLERLVGRAHAVLTGWTAIGDGAERFGVEETIVTMRPRTRVELDNHVANTRPFDKAGAYALQEDDGWLVSDVRGSRSNVMGLPLRPVVDALRDLGIERSTNEGSSENTDEI
ncbi:MAG: Maf family protein [Acidimicrobiia bacterium]